MRKWLSAATLVRLLVALVIIAFLVVLVVLVPLPSSLPAKLAEESRRAARREFRGCISKGVIGYMNNGDYWPFQEQSNAAIGSDSDASTSLSVPTGGVPSPSP